jgi:acetyl esterase/lipase
MPPNNESSTTNTNNNTTNTNTADNNNNNNHHHSPPPNTTLNILTHANYWISTLTFYLIQRAIFTPTAATFFIGWIGSELVHLLMLAKVINLYILHELNPSMFESFLGNAVFVVNVYNMIRFSTSLFQGIFSYKDYNIALAGVGIERRAGTRNPFLSAIISLIPIFAISNRFKKISYKRDIPYALLQDTDPELWKRVQRTPTKLKWLNVYIGRGFMEGWNKLDIVRLDNDVKTTQPLQPVLFYIHGGGWCVGDKLFAAHSSVARIASRGIVVATINYRLSPDVAFPAHIHDCKRALIWVKQHIHEYGGDANKIFVIGESAGGHLASLVSTTENFMPFQPPESPMMDTSVMGCIALYGVFDWEDTDGHLQELHPSVIDGLPGGMRPFIERLVIQKPYKTNKNEFAQASPTWHVRQKILDSTTTRPKLPPFMVIHGTCDSLAAFNDSKTFYDELVAFRTKYGYDTKMDVFVCVNGGHHAFGYITSPRSTALGDAVVDFISHHVRLK